ncbi:MAG: MBL fold metallo-hydrolase [Gemmatimonadaceae bacterium]|nr:MBL fold metallo-hydrolase [Gemmatimonadaceae bacterium]
MNGGLRADFERTGGRFVEYDKPVELLPGVWFTGPVPRTYPEKNWSGTRQVRTPTGDVEDNVPEDASIVIDTPEGLVLISGCGHAGIVNTVEYARSAIRQAPVVAAIGGFHLFNATDTQLAWTAGKLKEAGLTYLLGGHCTGIEAVYRLRELVGLTRRTAVVSAVGSRSAWKGIGAAALWRGRCRGRVSGPARGCGAGPAPRPAARRAGPRPARLAVWPAPPAGVWAGRGLAAARPGARRGPGGRRRRCGAARRGRGRPLRRERVPRARRRAAPAAWIARLARPGPARSAPRAPFVFLACSGRAGARCGAGRRAAARRAAAPARPRGRGRGGAGRAAVAGAAAPGAWPEPAVVRCPPAWRRRAAAPMAAPRSRARLPGRWCASRGRRLSLGRRGARRAAAGRRGGAPPSPSPLGAWRGMDSWFGRGAGVS